MHYYPRDHDPLLIRAEQAWQDNDMELYDTLVKRWYAENGYQWTGFAWTRG